MSQKRVSENESEESPKRPCVAAVAEVTDRHDADTVSDIDEQSVQPSDQDDDVLQEFEELEEEGGEKEEGEVAQEAPVTAAAAAAAAPASATPSAHYAAFYFDYDRKLLRVRCLHCGQIFTTNQVETWLKPVDVEITTSDELHNGHMALSCNVVVKRRLTVKCTRCCVDMKIANNALDKVANEVLGDVINTVMADDSNMVESLRQQVRTLSTQSFMTTLSAL